MFRILCTMRIGCRYIHFIFKLIIVFSFKIFYYKFPFLQYICYVLLVFFFYIKTKFAGFSLIFSWISWKFWENSDKSELFSDLFSLYAKVKVDMMTDKCWLQKQYISETAIKVYKIPYRIFDDAPGVHNFKNLPPAWFLMIWRGWKFTLQTTSFFNLINTCLPKKYLFSYFPLKIIYFPNLANKTLELQNIFKRGGGLFSRITPLWFFWWNQYFQLVVEELVGLQNQLDHEPEPEPLEPQIMYKGEFTKNNKKKFKNKSVFHRMLKDALLYFRFQILKTVNQLCEWVLDNGFQATCWYTSQGLSDVVRSLSRGDLNFFLFRKHPLGPENPLKSIDFTGQGGLSPIASPPHGLRLWGGRSEGCIMHTWFPFRSYYYYYFLGLTCLRINLLHFY